MGQKSSIPFSCVTFASECWEIMVSLESYRRDLQELDRLLGAQETHLIGTDLRELSTDESAHQVQKKHTMVK